MQNKCSLFFLLLFPVFCSVNASAQFQEPLCFHVEKVSNPSRFLVYLMNNYGVEKTERILMEVKAYELKHDVRVFYKEEYLEIQERLDQLLVTATDQELIDSIWLKKSKMVLFDHIETSVIH